MKYQVEIKNIEATRVVYKSYKGPVSNAGKLMPSIFQSIKGKANGAPFFCIHSINEETKEAEIDVCVPTQELPIKNDVQVMELASVQAVCATHIGNYQDMGLAYQSIRKYVDENKFEIVGACREVYIKGPGLIVKGNPKKYITEIILPIEGGEV